MHACRLADHGIIVMHHGKPPHASRARARLARCSRGEPEGHLDPTFPRDEVHAF